MSNATVELLTAAKAKIQDPENWTKDVALRRKPAGGYAFCSLGALNEAWIEAYDSAGSRPIVGFAAAREFLEKVVYFDLKKSTVVAFNDDENTTHSDVMALFDRAIERAKGDDQ